VSQNSAGRMMPWVLVPPRRKYRLYLPSAEAGARPRAMVVMIHGCRQDALAFAQGTRINALADRDGFAVLYPDQSDAANPQRCWNWFEARTLAGEGEAAILVSMIERAAQRAQLEARHVVLAGMSSGAALAALLAYQQPARFAGVLVHSGLPPHAAHTVPGALDAMRDGAKLDIAALTQRYWAAQALPPPPLRIVHGSADPVVHRANADLLFELWASLLQAESPDGLERTQRTVHAPHAGARAQEVTTLRAHANWMTEKIIVQGLQHAWSGGDAALPYNDAAEPSASELIAQWVIATRCELSDSSPA
jgi:poly(hydroxyalkanoate) depolymerase family esterase